MEINGNWISDVQVSLGNGAGGESPAVFGRGAGGVPKHGPAALRSGVGPAAPGGRAAGAEGPLLSPEGCARCWVTLRFLGEEKCGGRITLRWGSQSGAALVKKCLGGGISGAALSAQWSFQWWWWKWPRCCFVARREAVTSSL